MSKPPTKPAPVETPAHALNRRGLRRLTLVTVAIAMVWVAAMVWIIFELRAGAQQSKAMDRFGEATGIRRTWSGRIQGIRLKGVGDDRFQQLAAMELPDLRILQLTDCTLSPQSIQQLVKFDQLYELNLRRTPLQPSAVDTLSQLKTLHQLDVTGSGLTFPQIRQIEETLPHVRVIK